MKYIKGNKVLEISQDEDIISSRENDNVGIMAFFHSRYSLPNETELKTGDFDGWDAMKNHIEKELKGLCIIKVYAYDHSGFSISTNNNYPYNDRWDSGTLGFIFTTKERLKEFGVKYSQKKIQQSLELEIETFNQELTGDVYSFILKNKKECKECGITRYVEFDSCGGFYGTDWKKNGLLDATGIKSLKGWKQVEQ